jgi:hypothetical protein
MKRVSGIYAIVNLKTDTKYIGSSINIKRRFEGHKNRLRNNIHFNPQLQKDWNELGEGYFVFVILEEVIANIEDRERELIEQLKLTTKVYNITLPKTTTQEVKVPKSVGIKLSETHKRRKEENPLLYKESFKHTYTKIIAESETVCIIFESVREAEAALNIPYKKIQEGLAGKRSMGQGVVKVVNHVRGYKFYYYEKRNKETDEQFTKFA